jgi:hypothetical protein
VAGESAVVACRALFEVRVELAEVLSLGLTPLGERRVIDILGGTFRGERLAGRVRPGGADWQIVGADGTAHLDARYTLQTDAGALIQVRSQGLRHGPADVLARLATGQPVDPAAYYFRTALRFETAAPALDWLNRILAIGVGARQPRAVELRVFEVL